MAKPKIPKHLERDQWEVSDHISYMQSGELPLNPKWKEARAEALAGAGLEDEDEPVAREDQSIEEIARGMDSSSRKVAD